MLTYLTYTVLHNIEKMLRSMCFSVCLLALLNPANAAEDFPTVTVDQPSPPPVNNKIYISTTHSLEDPSTTTLNNKISIKMLNTSNISDEKDAPTVKDVEQKIPSSLNEAYENAKNKLKKHKLFFNQQRTTTQTNVVFATSTIPVYCLSSVKTDATCPTTGRRKKRQAVNHMGYKKNKDEVNKYMLAGSQQLIELDEMLTDTETSDDEQGEGKNFFTFWTRVIATTTLTSISTNTASTASLVFYCSSGAINYPPNCG